MFALVPAAHANQTYIENCANCRICLAPATFDVPDAHVTSRCPFLKGKRGFIQTRYANSENLMSSLRTSRGPARERGRGGRVRGCRNPQPRFPVQPAALVPLQPAQPAPSQFQRLRCPFRPPSRRLIKPIHHPLLGTNQKPTPKKTAGKQNKRGSGRSTGPFNCTLQRALVRGRRQDDKSSSRYTGEGCYG